MLGHEVVISTSVPHLRKQIAAAGVCVCVCVCMCACMHVELNITTNSIKHFRTSI